MIVLLLLLAAQFFDDRVAPILRARCLGCHNDELKAGGVSLVSRDSLLKRGGRGAAIVPGKLNESLLIQAIRQDGELKMPPGAKLSAEDIATLTEWVEQGAPWGTKLGAAADSKSGLLPFEIWLFDRINKLGDHPARVLGHPRVAGNAVEFDGVDDALLVDVHPLAGAQTFTWEVVFRPDAGGAAEQRVFELQERDSSNGLSFEIRVVDGRWSLVASQRRHASGAWYHVAMVYDGRELRSYVDGVLEGAAALQLTPPAEGRCSAGAGINRRGYFKGAIRMARMTRGALAPEEFLRLPRL